MPVNLRKLGQVARFEFVSTMRRRSVQLVMFGLPLLLLVIMSGLNYLARTETGESADGGAASVLEGIIGSGSNLSIPAGLIDDTGRVRQLTPAAEQLFQSHENLESAQAAFEAGELSSYYHIPADYFASPVIAHYTENRASPREDAERQALYQSLVVNLIEEPEIVEQVMDPARISEVNLDPNRNGADDSRGFGVQLGLMIGTAMLFFITIVGASGYLLQSLGKEKQNRVMEILLSSLRPLELLLGKIIGLGGIGFVQLGIWVALYLLVSRLDDSVFGNITLPALSVGHWLLVLAYFLAGYFVYASLLAGLGAVAPNPKEGSQYTFLLLLPVMIPLWFSNIFWTAPNGAATVFLSLFPLTAPLAMPMRLTAVGVPPWQLVLSLLLAVLTGAATVWLATRVFHSRALLSGHSLSGRLVWQMLRGE